MHPPRDVDRGSTAPFWVSRSCPVRQDTIRRTYGAQGTLTRQMAIERRFGFLRRGRARPWAETDQDTGRGGRRHCPCFRGRLPPPCGTRRWFKPVPRQRAAPRPASASSALTLTHVTSDGRQGNAAMKPLKRFAKTRNDATRGQRLFVL